MTRREPKPKAPGWKRGDLTDRIHNHVYAEAIYQRQVGDDEQVIERVRLQPTNAYERSSYRLVEVRGGRARVVGAYYATLREARVAGDRREHLIMADSSRSQAVRAPVFSRLNQEPGNG